MLPVRPLEYGLPLLLAAVLLLLSSPAQAAPSIGCDLHRLSLSPHQDRELRRLRAEYRHRADVLVAEARSARRNAAGGPRHLLEEKVFSEQKARQYVTNKYAIQIQREIETLRAQHSLLQVLTPQQKQEWMRYCLIN